MNILAKRVQGKEYIITDFIATKLNEAQFNKIKDLNKDTLGGYSFVPFKDTDFTWWSRVNKKLTPKNITEAYFDIDFYGNVTEVN